MVKAKSRAASRTKARTAASRGKGQPSLVKAVHPARPDVPYFLIEPSPRLAKSLINELLGAEMQTKLQPETYAFPSNVDAPPPPGIPADTKVHSLDWQFVAKEREAWVKRWDRDMAI